MMTFVRMDMRLIQDWPSFHAQFAKTFGFPAFYGNNMNAWIDCMTSLDSPGDGMTTIHCKPPEVVVLQLDQAMDLKTRQPELLEAIISSAAFVNWRKIEMGEPAVLALSYWEH